MVTPFNRKTLVSKLIICLIPIIWQARSK